MSRVSFVHSITHGDIMVTKKARKPAFNRKQFDVLCIEVGRLNQQLIEAHVAHRESFEQLVSENERLRGCLKEMEQDSLRREADYEKLAIENAQYIADVIKTINELDEVKLKIEKLQILTDFSHSTVLRYSNLIIDLVIGRKVLQKT